MAVKVNIALVNYLPDSTHIAIVLDRKSGNLFWTVVKA